MPASQWHKFYPAHVAAPPGALFELLADLSDYGRWLPGSQQFGQTTDVAPYPVQLGSRYHDGKPDEPGKDWWGPSPENDRTRVSRWLVLDITMPAMHTGEAPGACGATRPPGRGRRSIPRWGRLGRPGPSRR
jgi:hypothetical protein